MGEEWLNVKKKINQNPLNIIYGLQDMAGPLNNSVKLIPKENSFIYTKTESQKKVSYYFDCTKRVITIQNQQIKFGSAVCRTKWIGKHKCKIYLITPHKKHLLCTFKQIKTNYQRHLVNLYADAFEELLDNNITIPEEIDAQNYIEEKSTDARRWLMAIDAPFIDGKRVIINQYIGKTYNNQMINELQIEADKLCREYFQQEFKVDLVNEEVRKIEDEQFAINTHQSIKIAMLTRYLYQFSVINEEEFIIYRKKIGIILQQEHDSFVEMANVFLTQRHEYLKDHLKVSVLQQEQDEIQMREKLASLVNDQQSIWNIVPWDTYLKTTEKVHQIKEEKNNNKKKMIAITGLLIIVVILCGLVFTGMISV